MSRWIAVGSSPEVEDPKTVPGAAALLARASTFRLHSSRSGKLSCTKSTPVTASSTEEAKAIVPSAGSGASVSLEYARRALAMIAFILLWAAGSTS